MSNIPSPGQIYRHFKGNLYRIVTLAEDSETGDMLVIYQALYGKYKVYARPLSMFTERLDKRKYPDAGADFRFELQKELIEAPVMGEAFGEKEALSERKNNPQNSDPISERENDLQNAAATVEYDDDSQKKASADSDEAFREEVVSEGSREQEEELNIDPLVLDFLDARTYEERLKILSQLRPRITDSMINVMSIAVDVEIKDGDTEERFDELRACLSTRNRYESRNSRLR